MSAHVIQAWPQPVLDQPARSRGVAPNGSDQLVYIRRDDRELFGGRTQGRRDGERRRRNFVDQRREKGTL